MPAEVWPVVGGYLLLCAVLAVFKRDAWRDGYTTGYLEAKMNQPRRFTK